MPSFLTIGRGAGKGSRRGGGDLSSTAPDAVIQSLIDGELDGGTISFYTGPQPASTADAPSSVTKLSDLTLATPAAPLANLIASDQIFLNTLGGTVYVSGTPAWARVMSVDATHIYDFVVSTTAGTNTLVVNTVTWTAGQTLSAITLKAQG